METEVLVPAADADTDETNGDLGENLDETPVLTAKQAKAEDAKMERRDLRRLESIVTKGDKSLSLMAEALTEIRDRRLYKRSIDPNTGKPYKAFAMYLLGHKEWGFTAQYANRLIANLRDQKQIEAGHEPEPRKTVGPKEMSENEAAMKIARSFGQFAETIAKYRDAVESDKFRADFDKMYGSVEKTVDAFIKRYPAPVAAQRDEATEGETADAE